MSKVRLTAREMVEGFALAALGIALLDLLAIVFQ